MGRRALIHKQSARGFVCSRQGSQAAPRTSGPNCVSEEVDAGAVANSAIVSFPVHVGQWPTHPLILLGTPYPSPNTQTGMASQILHPKSCTASQGQRIWQTDPGAPRLPEEQSWEGCPGGQQVQWVLSLLASGHQCWEQKCMRRKVHLE